MIPDAYFYTPEHLEALKKQQEDYKKSGKHKALRENTEKFKQGMQYIGSWLKTGLSDLWNGLTGKTSANATLEANKMNIENQNYWNEISMQREDTAHQREMADLQAAGLNPWLSVGGGAQSTMMSTAQAEPVDGSKMLQATSAAALLGIVKLLSRSTTRDTKSTNINYIIKK